jgi:hypothetical protein
MNPITERLGPPKSRQNSEPEVQNDARSPKNVQGFRCSSRNCSRQGREPGSYRFVRRISTDKRACVYRHGFTWTAFRTSDSSQYGDNRSLDRSSLRNVSPKSVGTGYLHHWAQYLLHLCCQRTTAIAAICDGERFASFTRCATIILAMSAQIFVGDCAGNSRIF